MRPSQHRTHAQRDSLPFVCKPRVRAGGECSLQIQGVEVSGSVVLGRSRWATFACGIACFACRIACQGGGCRQHPSGGTHRERWTLGVDALTWVAGETAASDCTRQITRLHSAREAGRSRSGVTTTGACNMCVGARRQVERVGVQGHAVWGEGFLEGCFARGGDEGGKGRPHETVSVMFVYGVRCAEPLCSGA